MEAVPDSGSAEESQLQPVIERVVVMQVLNNNKGVALVISLMLTLISLTIVIALLYVVTQGIQVSSQTKRYHTALDASYGGAEIMVKDIMPVLMQNYLSSSFKATVQTSFAGVSLLMVSDSTCLQSKIRTNTSAWPTGCSNTSNPKSSPDLQITLQSASGNPFIVSSKIVDTIAGNSDVSGLQLEGSGTAESSSLLTPQHFPYIYRMDIQGESQNNSTAQANLEVLYAY